MITIKHLIRYRSRADKDLSDFVVACTKLFDSVYDEEPLLTLKEKSSRSNGGYNRNWIRGMNITLRDMRFFSTHPFREYKNYHWWKTPTTHPYVGLYILMVHEYSHIITFSRYASSVESHGGEYYLVCQEVESSISFDECFKKFRQARVIF